MGTTYAATLAVAVADGELDLHTALTEHFRRNFYPALDDAYATVAVTALAATLSNGPEVLDYVIALPDGLHTMPAERHLYRSEAGRVGMTARTALEVLQLDPFVDAAATL